MTERRVGVLGATSLVGGSIIPLLINDSRHVFAVSRKISDSRVEVGVTWMQLAEPTSHIHSEASQIEDWLCMAPIWILPQYFSMLEIYGVRRVVALSSTSRFTKTNSSDAAESIVAVQLAEGEARLQTWAESRGIEWVILRPTLIYGLGQDKNIAEIARFIGRFGFFPLFGKANGLRQPIHVEDVAGACLAALQTSAVRNRAYNISGGEILTYRDMVERVFTVLKRRPRLLSVPLWFFRMAIAVLRCLSRYRKWSAAMAERMNRDMVFDHADAARDLDFKPRKFILSAEDLPA